MGGVQLMARGVTSISCRLSLFLSLGLLIPEIYFLICLKVETGHKKQPGKNSTAAETVVPDHLPLTIQQSRARLHDTHSQS